MLSMQVCVAQTSPLFTSPQGPASCPVPPKHGDTGASKVDEFSYTPHKIRHVHYSYAKPLNHRDLLKGWGYGVQLSSCEIHASARSMNKIDPPSFPVSKMINGINKYQRFSTRCEHPCAVIRADTIKKMSTLLKHTKILPIRVLSGCTEKGGGAGPSAFRADYSFHPAFRSTQSLAVHFSRLRFMLELMSFPLRIAVLPERAGGGTDHECACLQNARGAYLKGA